MQLDFTAIETALENIATWVVLVAAVAVGLGGVWALVDTCITYGQARLEQKREDTNVVQRKAELDFAARVVPIRKELL